MVKRQPGRPREVKGKIRVVPLYLTEEAYDGYKKILPKNTSVSGSLRDYMQRRIEEQEERKNRVAQTGVDESLMKGEVVSTEKIITLWKAWFELNKDNFFSMDRVYKELMYKFYKRYRMLIQGEKMERKMLEKPNPKPEPRRNEKGQEILPIEYDYSSED